MGKVMESGEFGNLIDPKLKSNFVATEMIQMIKIAAACVRHSATKRPRMGQVKKTTTISSTYKHGFLFFFYFILHVHCQVVRAFDSLGSADLTNGMKVGESEVFNSAQQSEEIRWFRKMAFDAQDCSSKDFLSQGSSSNTHSREKRESDE